MNGTTRGGPDRGLRMAGAACAGLAGTAAVLAAWVGYAVDPGRASNTPGRAAAYGAGGLLGLAVPALLARGLTGRWGGAGLLLAVGPPGVMLLLLAARLT